MNFLSLIEVKRDGGTLSSAQIQSAISAFTAGQIPDYQMSAFLMAVYFQGLNPDETQALTLAMRDSGDRLAFPDDSRPLVDKHSTGGVGDKVSLPLAPLLACLGFRVPMISGRGLGITGGTLDKLESVPGFTTNLAAGQIARQVQEVGCVICGQTQRMVPADKALYALRDVTGTVPSIPLMTASILSKKLAEGLDALVLDVKFGRAAFMSTQANAKQLATSMTHLANGCGVNTRAVLTRMNTPLGRAAGNWLEVKEASECLEGRGPDDLQQLVVECAAHLLVQTRRADRLDLARSTARACLQSGEPHRKWNEMIAAQGADMEAYQRKLQLDSTAPLVVEIQAPHSGWISRCDARVIGEVIRDLGGGRLTKESLLNSDVGVDQLAKPGQAIGKGERLARVHARTANEARTASLALQTAFQITESPTEPEALLAGN